MFVDDSNILDLQSACGSGQTLAQFALAQLGTPVAAKKTIPLCQENEFVRVVHDLSKFPSGAVSTIAKAKQLSNAHPPPQANLQASR